jgi:hypothetical protein
MCGLNPFRVSMLASVAAIILGFASSADAAVVPISPLVEDPVTGDEYQLLSNADWTDSEAEAQSLGGYLATIEDQEQQDFVFDVFGGYQGIQRILWIGFYDPTQDANGGTHADNFVWASGAPVTYTNWNAGEPNDTNNAEFWTAMYYPSSSNPGSWNDWDNRTTDPIGIPFYGVVQFVPEPASIGSLLLGAAMIAFRRR